MARLTPRSRAATWALTAALLPATVAVAARPMVAAADLAEACGEEAVESVLCRSGHPTTTYDVTLWLYPALLLGTWLVVLGLVVAATRTDRRAWHLPLLGAAVVLVVTALHVGLVQA